MIPDPGLASPPARLARRLDRLCDRFEAAWQAGRRPILERYLSKVPPAAQPELLRELLVLELEYRARRGEKPEHEDYRRFFPEHAELIHTVFGEVSQAAPSSPYLVRRWTINRLANDLRTLLFPTEKAGAEGPDAGPGPVGAAFGAPSAGLFFSLLARMVGSSSAHPALDEASARSGVNTKVAPQQAEGGQPDAGGSSEPGTPTPLLEPAGLPSGTALDKENPAGTILGGYEILEQLGRGGMGVVYRAHQRSANRIVALKVIRSDKLADLTAEQRQEWFARFRQEAQIAAKLEHENLVAIYDMGKAGGHYYYSMRFVEGQSLAQILRQGPLSSGRAAGYLEPVARVLHELHELPEGMIVHRDLKPSNILIDNHDRPLVTDFGLAKCSAYTQGLTQSEGCLGFGTPEYIAPEQARNPAGVRPASDIYSLGATLYELLTGRPPFRADNPWETLRQVQEEEPLPPSRLNPAVHRDLGLICLKCLQKEPRKRYANALEVAEELRRYQAGEPLRHTRRVSHTERVWRWCRRKPALAAVTALALLALVATAVVSASFAIYQSSVVREKGLELAKHALNNGLAKCNEGKVSDGMLWLARSLELAPADAYDLNNLVRTNLAGWAGKLYPLKAILSPHDGRIVAVAYSGDARTILTATKDKAYLWDAASGMLIRKPIDVRGYVIAAALSPDGQTILTGGRDKVARLWDGSTGALRDRIVNYSGRLPLLVASQLAFIGCPLGHGHLLASCLTPLELTEVTAVAFSPNGKIIVTGGRDGTARFWDSATGMPIGIPLLHTGPVRCMGFSSDGKKVLIASRRLCPLNEGEARLWEVPTGRLLSKPLRFKSFVAAAAPSPDAKSIVVVYGATSKAEIWEVRTQNPVGKPIQLQAGVTTVAFSPDGKTFLAGSNDGTVQLRDIRTGLPLGHTLHHRDGITGVAFAPDSKSIFAASLDKTVRVWEAAPSSSRILSLAHQEERIQAGALSLDGTLAAGASGCKVDVWDLGKGRCYRSGLQHGKRVGVLVFAPDGKRLLSGNDDGTAKVWDFARGTAWVTPPDKYPVHWAAFSWDGNTVLTSSRDSARLWNAETGQPIGAPLHIDGSIHCVSSSRDGRMVVTGGKIAQVFSAATGEYLYPPLKQKKDVLAAVFSRDDRYVLTGSSDETAQLWDAKNGQRIGQPIEHHSKVTAVAFSPDSNLIVTGGKNQARLWDTATGQQRGAPLQHRQAVRNVAFSPDGRLVLTGEDTTVRFWDAATGRQCSPTLLNEEIILYTRFTPDGKTLVTVDGGRGVRYWKVPPPLQGTTEQIILWAKVITGMELDRTDSTAVLNPQQWGLYLNQLEKMGGPPSF